MSIEIIKTSEMVKMYFEENNITITDLINKGHVSKSTAYRFFSGETDLTFKLAQAINKVLPELTIEFLMSYDCKYKCYINQFSQNNDIKNTKESIDYFYLRELYPDLKKDETKLCEKGFEIYGKDNFIHKKFDDNLIKYSLFSKANNAVYRATYSWVHATLYEALARKKEVRNLDINKLNNLMNNIRYFCGTTSIVSTIDLMEEMCLDIGVNFCYRASLPNARVKGVTVLKNDEIFILMSDLFRCVENLWLTFIHELIHIRNNDLNKIEDFDENSKIEYEKNINEDVIKFLINNKFTADNELSLNEVINVANLTGVPINICAEICRFIKNKYDDTQVNQLIHNY